LEKSVHEEKLLQIIKSFSPDYLVLAKYMRILSPEFVQHFLNRIINIHHFFLPAFIDANSYKQAFQRGVKIIGATAHFVNNNLDKGRIIIQQVIPVGHTFITKDMAVAARDVEKIVLSSALKLLFNEKVLVSGNKTIVF
jgi:formyltetrahydrofolate deformylase